LAQAAGRRFWIEPFAGKLPPAADQEFETMAEKKFEQAVPVLSDSVSSTMAGLEKTQTAVTGNMEKTIKTAQEMVAFGQGNLEAIVKSSQIWAAGVQDLSKSFAASARVQIDETLATAKSFAAVKSLKDLLDLQTAFARNSLERAVAETAKLTDASTKLATGALAPITARVTLATKTFGRAA
jgi:phasin family protein